MIACHYRHITKTEDIWQKSSIKDRIFHLGEEVTSHRGPVWCLRIRQTEQASAIGTYPKG